MTLEYTTLTPELAPECAALELAPARRPEIALGLGEGIHHGGDLDDGIGRIGHLIHVTELVGPQRQQAKPVEIDLRQVTQAVPSNFPTADETRIWVPRSIYDSIKTYDFGQSTRASVGGMLSIGNSPTTGTVPELRSEYGTYGDVYMAQLVVFF